MVTPLEIGMIIPYMRLGELLLGHEPTQLNIEILMGKKTIAPFLTKLYSIIQPLSKILFFNGWIKNFRNRRCR